MRYELLGRGEKRPADPSATGQVITLGQRPPKAGFTPRDLLEIERWTEPGRRSTVCQDEAAPFAMLYRGREPWASWGLSREGARVTLWDCVTFADIGHFTSMHDAIAAVPDGSAAPAVPLANVIALTPTAE